MVYSQRRKTWLNTSIWVSDGMRANVHRAQRLGMHVLTQLHLSQAQVSGAASVECTDGHRWPLHTLPGSLAPTELSHLHLQEHLLLAKDSCMLLLLKNYQ